MLQVSQFARPAVLSADKDSYHKHPVPGKGTLLGFTLSYANANRSPLHNRGLKKPIGYFSRFGHKRQYLGLLRHQNMASRRHWQGLTCNHRATPHITMPCHVLRCPNSAAIIHRLAGKNILLPPSQCQDRFVNKNANLGPIWTKTNKFDDKLSEIDHKGHPNWTREAALCPRLFPQINAH